MTKKHVLPALCLLLTLALLMLCPRLLMRGDEQVPGLTGRDRKLVRIWVLSAPGGGQAWLTEQLKQFERQYPGLSTYLRTVTPADLADPEAVWPDVLLYMPGDMDDPIRLQPLTSAMFSQGLLREELLRCGRWRGEQIGLPLCWGAWVLAIDSALEPGSAAPPAPTTLLGKPAASPDAQATAEPGYPLAAAAQADCPLQSPGGAALFTLGLLTDALPPLPADFAALSSAEVYSAFRSRRCATAMLTSGQLTAFTALTSGGSGFPFRVMAAEEVITDQVWLAGVPEGAAPEAALLLSYLTSVPAQEALARQALHTVRADLTLYAAGTAAQLERAARRSLSAVNAFVPAKSVADAAWQFLQDRCTLSEALLPLL